MEKGTVFFPEKEILETPADYGIDFEDVFFKTDDGLRLHGWWVVHPFADKTILWFHGNAGNIGDRAHNLALMYGHLNVNIFIFDYREYGKSEGSISRAGTYIDAEGAYRWVRDSGIEPRSLVLFGRSLGTALAAYIAKKHPCAGLILEAAFTSSKDMISLYAPHLAEALREKGYDTLGIIKDITVPVLFVHGSHDEAIPLWMAQKLYESANHPKELYIVSGAGHNDTYITGGSEYFRALRNFLDSL
ncbi:alpha/beta hydrolase [Thermodesulforhabdus norvegica]|uniref:Serine aminopeptidase S33 domain-containing protein n=1 Tax=Thermodesulforhabdus norvegica TaxID=39841 RepID=A0A1I4V508_9BACT|nr:alpha/beta hydrolase [Thermodesulforhabdus norvegica]SFM96286.1 hypothetical protein SAMN05660836_02111 [Thermodesulforhabdus norvegica]